MREYPAIPQMREVQVREDSFCLHRGELKAASVFDSGVCVRDLAGLERSVMVPMDEVEFIHEVGDYAIGLHTGDKDGQRVWSGSSDYHLICTDISKVYEFFQNNSQDHGFTIQYAINTRKGVVVEVFKKGKLTKKICKMLLNMGFDQFFFSDCWFPKMFLINGEVVPVAAEFSLVDGSDLNPWTRALYGKEVPPSRNRWEVQARYPEYLERLNLKAQG